ncbi:hypothetical protein, partial [Bacteroides heparinolyticus]|uniref:hypothetical protein n=1 Tax=Prevotella heparinolytica TaxID=28113 RepID=UPI0035A099C3
ILRTTVVFPEPVPPAIPIINIRLSIYLKQNLYFCCTKTGIIPPNVSAKEDEHSFVLCRYKFCCS